MSNLSELLPAGAGAKSADFVASGTLGSGVTVALKTDGTVEAVAYSASSTGTSVVFEAASVNYLASAYDSNSNKVVVAYADNGNTTNGTAVVGTVSGTSISFGTPVVYETGAVYQQTMAFDSSANKIVISYANTDNSFYGTAVVGTVSGTSISFGSSVVFQSALTFDHAAVYDTTANKTVIAYRNRADNDYGYAIVGTVSGTSISFGTTTRFVAAVTTQMSATYDSTNSKVVIAYANNSNSSYGTAVVGTVSGTSMTFGTPVVFESASTTYTSSVYDTANARVVVTYVDGGNSSYGTSVVGAVSGTAISFGTPVVWYSSATTQPTSSYDVSTGQVVVSFHDNPGANFQAVSGAVSGDSISFGSLVVLASIYAYPITSTYDEDSQRIILSYRDLSNSSYGTSLTFKDASTNSADFIGITDQAIADTATGAVIVQGGVSEKLSGLTVGADYYVQDDGSLTSSSIPFDISGASYDSVSFGVSAQDATPTSIRFNTTGTKMFVIGESSDNVNEYNLSIAFDISTSVFNQSFSVSAQEIQPRGLVFNNNGTKMFVVGGSGDDVNEYVLSVGFDISTSAFVQNFSVSTEMFSPSGIAFNSDGTKMFVCGSTNDSVFEYYLTSGFDISTASFVDSISVSSEEASPFDIAFNNDGTKMFIAGATGDAVYEYSLLTGFDISTATYVISFSVAGEEDTIQGIAFNTTGTKFYITGSTTDAVYQYSTAAASTTVPAGRALSSSSILLEG